MKQYKGGNWVGLIADFAHDVVLGHKIIPSDNKMPEEEEEAHVHKAAFLSLFQCS
jgi:hypothetical protein